MGGDSGHLLLFYLLSPSLPLSIFETMFDSAQVAQKFKESYSGLEKPHAGSSHSSLSDGQSNRVIQQRQKTTLCCPHSIFLSYGEICWNTREEIQEVMQLQKAGSREWLGSNLRPGGYALQLVFAQDTSWS